MVLLVGGGGGGGGGSELKGGWILVSGGFTVVCYCRGCMVLPSSS